MSQTATLTTALYDTHVGMKGKMVPFGGYLLPVWFTSLKDEHLAVRNSAGIFDISHMGLLHLSGPQVGIFIQTLFCNDLRKTQGGKMVYGMVLNGQGGILDDVMVGEVSDGFLMVVNASNKAKIQAWIASHNPGTVLVKDLNEDFGFVAVQGPQAVAKLDSILDTQLRDNPRFSVRAFSALGQQGLALRTGYTGEDGFELIFPKEQLTALWKACVTGGIQPCGLAARDTLRLEVGLPLYGQELREDLTPLMTRYQWVVKWDQPFIGREALLVRKDNAQTWATVGLEMQERVIARSHYEIQEGGEVTSGTLSPSLDKPVAMALVKPEFSSLGQVVHVKIRDVFYPAKVVEVPFK